jgi:hypothetical protein
MIQELVAELCILFWVLVQNQQPLRVWDAEVPGRPLFDMWFAEDAVDR